jgi:DNA-binding transcriptional regulator YhcF (GntR family)
MFRQLPATNYLETCVIVVWLVFYVCMERYDYARLTATALITVSQLSHFPSGIQFAHGLEQSGTNHMDIRIDRKSEVPVRQQVAEQIIFSIATEQVKPGQALPSVRELARRLKIHHNTVSQAYQDLARRTWVVRRHGSRVVVRSPAERAEQTNRHDVDDLINATIRFARERGYSLQALRERVRTRLLAEPPDHILVVEEEPGLRRLLQQEIRTALGQPAEGCSVSELAAEPGLAIGALTVAGQYIITDVDRLVPKAVPAISLAFSAADEHLELLRRLDHPSVVFVVSVSRVFLQTARSLLAPALGRRHVMRDFLFPPDDPKALRAADLVFADSIARPGIKHSKIFEYRLICPSSLEYLRTAAKSYQLRLPGRPDA